MSATDDLLRKVQGLLAKAEGTDNENEAEAFFGKARELMLKHSIDEMTVRASMKAAGQAEAVILEDFMFSRSDSNAVGLAQLLFQVSKSMDVRMLKYHNGRNSNLGRTGNDGLTASQWCALVGYKSDIDAVKMMYVSLLVQDRQLARGAWKTYTGGRAKVSGESKFRTGHLVGFATRVGARLMEAKRKVVNETNTSALILAKDVDVNDAFKNFFPLTRTGKGHVVDNAGVAAGRLNGDRADIGHVRIGTNARQIGSGR